MELVNLFRKKRQTLVSLFLLFLVIGLILVLLQDFKYGTKSKILVIQEGAGRVDPFSVSRSVEYLSDLFTKVVYSNSFFDAVMESDFNIDKNYFGQSFDKKMKTWRKTVSAKGLEDSGIITISVYHQDSYQATQIALAINHVLMTEHQTYHGLGSSVKINVIDQPIVSPYPVKPNLIYSIIIIIAVSLFFGLMYIYIFPERKYDINFFGKSDNDYYEGKNINKYSSGKLTPIQDILSKKNIEIKKVETQEDFENKNNSNIDSVIPLEKKLAGNFELLEEDNFKKDDMKENNKEEDERVDNFNNKKPDLKKVAEDYKYVENSGSIDNLFDD
jgi:capsular polysaccharide biosynthesis protein